MPNTQGNLLTLLFSAFIIIILGVVLIRPIADDVALTKVSLNTITNESISLTATTVDVINETLTMDADNITATLVNNYLTALTEVLNVTGEDISSECNVTLTTGVLICNTTNSNKINASYTYNSYSTGQLSTNQDEWKSFDACRNSDMNAILAGTNCNLTLTTGAVKVNYDNFTDDLAFIDYKYEPDTYVHSSTARTLITLVILLFAIAILAIGIGYAIKSFKEGGMM